MTGGADSLVAMAVMGCGDDDGIKFALIEHVAIIEICTTFSVSFAAMLSAPASISHTATSLASFLLDRGKRAMFAMLPQPKTPILISLAI